MKKVRVPLGDRSYTVSIQPGLLTQAGYHLKKLPGLPTRGVLITNRIVSGYYEKKVMASLRRAGFEMTPLYVPDGEKAKTLAVAERLYHKMLRLKLGRRCLVVALGGGVVGDLAGYVAATYLRGVPFVQIPTTLLAQVDSSVGGKVAVNLPEGKNLIGAFYQPLSVLIDPLCLKTLPVKEFRCGMAEVIKYGFISDPSLFRFCMKQSRSLNALRSDPLTYIIEKSVRIKAQVVARDEREAGIRATLNFGHTFGHAIEKTWQYKTYTHGEAVAIGMRMACEFSVQQGFFSARKWEQVRPVFGLFGLRDSLPQDAGLRRSVFRNLAFDKKRVDAGLMFIMIQKMGQVVPWLMTEPEEIRNFIRDFR